MGGQEALRRAEPRAVFAAVFLAAVFLAAVFLAAVFLAADFLAAVFFAADFFAAVFLVAVVSALRVLSLVTLRVLPGLWLLLVSRDACSAARRSTTLASSASPSSGRTISRFRFFASISFCTRSV